MDYSDNKAFTKNAIEIAIKIAILGTLIILTFQLIRPFLIPVVWGIILAVATDPFVNRVSRLLGGRKFLAAAFFVLLVLAILVVPTLFLVSSSVDAVQSITEHVQNKTLAIPPPPAKVADWPIIGESVHQVWQLAATNLEAALKQFAPEIKSATGTVLGSVGGGLAGIFMIIISTFIAGVFLAKSEKSAALARKIINRISGERGAAIASLSTATIRGVMQGVVGVAVIQAVLSAIGMIAVGVPATGLWTALVLVCAVSQLPPLLVLGPVAAYVYSVADTTPAVIFIIWTLIIGCSDGILKPLLMGRGIEIPMLVILIGALGGMLMAGILGLFVGAVVLAIMYTLFMAWVDDDEINNETLGE